MRHHFILAASAVVASLLGVQAVSNQVPVAGQLPDAALREYAGTYQWAPQHHLDLQLWNELAGHNQLVAFDDSGEIRTLYPTERDRFFAGPGAALKTPVESTIEFQRDRAGKVTSLTWQRTNGPRRVARRVEIERRDSVTFANGSVRLSGTLIAPRTAAKHPAIILVHGSGATDREYMLPFAYFLVRHGVAILGYDKRGVGTSTGDWRSSSFEDLAGDVVAAFEYLKTRRDIDASQIGLLGVSQAGWVMPLAAARAPDMAFLISISGAGISAAETTIDHARNEMTVRRMAPEAVDGIVNLMKLQYRFAQTGDGWEAYTAERELLVKRFGRAPDNFPGSQDDPYWGEVRRMYFHDPAPTLQRLRLPILSLFGELDNNIVATKNRDAWESALKSSGHRDYTLLILPKGNHILLEAAEGNNAEMASLQRFVSAYRTTVRDWLAARVERSRR